ncbi:hypothetical protein C8R43DRAFT_959561 [Mycena crocata]|nr:hypothetical protein C8R43DRAFT_959561 [Mycena crocata]
MAITGNGTGLSSPQDGKLDCATDRLQEFTRHYRHTAKLSISMILIEGEGSEKLNRGKVRILKRETPGAREQYEYDEAVSRKSQYSVPKNEGDPTIDKKYSAALRGIYVSIYNVEAKSPPSFASVPPGVRSVIKKELDHLLLICPVFDQEPHHSFEHHAGGQAQCSVIPSVPRTAQRCLRRSPAAIVPHSGDPQLSPMQSSVIVIVARIYVPIGLKEKQLQVENPEKTGSKLKASRVGRKKDNYAKITHKQRNSCKNLE